MPPDVVRFYPGHRGWRSSPRRKPHNRADTDCPIRLCADCYTPPFSPWRGVISVYGKHAQPLESDYWRRVIEQIDVYTCAHPDTFTAIKQLIRLGNLHAAVNLCGEVPFKGWRGAHAFIADVQGLMQVGRA